MNKPRVANTQGDNSTPTEACMRSRERECKSPKFLSAQTKGANATSLLRPFAEPLPQPCVCARPTYYGGSQHLSVCTSRIRRVHIYASHNKNKPSARGSGRTPLTNAEKISTYFRQPKKNAHSNIQTHLARGANYVLQF